MAAFKSASSSDRGAPEPTLVPAAPAARARKLSLALQGGGSLSAFTWGVLDRLLEAPDFEIGAISGASAGAVNAALLASGLAEGGRDGARRSLAQFWNYLAEEASFRSLMLIGAFSPAGSSVAFGPALQFDPFDLDPLREVAVRPHRFRGAAQACLPQTPDRDHAGARRRPCASSAIASSPPTCCSPRSARRWCIARSRSRAALTGTAVSPPTRRSRA